MDHPRHPADSVSHGEVVMAKHKKKPKLKHVKKVVPLGNGLVEVAAVFEDVPEPPPLLVDEPAPVEPPPPVKSWWERNFG